MISILFFCLSTAFHPPNTCHTPHWLTNIGDLAGHWCSATVTCSLRQKPSCDENRVIFWEHYKAHYTSRIHVHRIGLRIYGGDEIWTGKNLICSTVSCVKLDGAHNFFFTNVLNVKNSSAHGQRGALITGSHGQGELPTTQYGLISAALILAKFLLQRIGTKIFTPSNKEH